MSGADTIKVSFFHLTELIATSSKGDCQIYSSTREQRKKMVQ